MLTTLPSYVTQSVAPRLYYSKYPIRVLLSTKFLRKVLATSDWDNEEYVPRRNAFGKLKVALEYSTTLEPLLRKGKGRKNVRCSLVDNHNSVTFFCYTEEQAMVFINTVVSDPASQGLDIVFDAKSITPEQAARVEADHKVEYRKYLYKKQFEWRIKATQRDGKGLPYDEFAQMIGAENVEEKDTPYKFETKFICEQFIAEIGVYDTVQHITLYIRDTEHALVAQMLFNTCDVCVVRRAVIAE